MKYIYYHVQFLFSFRFISVPHKSVFLVTYLSGNIMIIILPKVLLFRQYLHISLLISLFTSLCKRHKPAGLMASFKTNIGIGLVSSMILCGKD